jgi:hypothetical protein
MPECKSDWEIDFTLAKRFNPQAVPWGDVPHSALFTPR